MQDLVGRTVVDEPRTRDPENGVYLVIDNERTALEERYRRKAIRHMAVVHLFLGSLAVTPGEHRAQPWAEVHCGGEEESQDNEITSVLADICPGY